MMKKYQIGIIGHGNFSQVLVAHLAPYAEIVVYDERRELGEADGVRFVTVEDALAQPIIIPSIPAQFLETFFTNHRHLVNPEAVVIDVCSVKVVPLQLLERLLPSTCRLIGTHPMFGPASIERNGGIVGLPIALCPVRANAILVDELRHLLSATLGLRIIETTPEEHDRQMAYVQGLSHYIGRVMDVMQIPSSELQTAAYEDLLDMKRIQGNDSWDLFTSIMHENPYTHQVHQQFKIACTQLDVKLNL